MPQKPRRTGGGAEKPFFLSLCEAFAIVASASITKPAQEEPASKQKRTSGNDKKSCRR